MRPCKTATLMMRTPVKQAREKYKGATIVLIAVVKQARENLKKEKTKNNAHKKEKYLQED